MKRGFTFIYPQNFGPSSSHFDDSTVASGYDFDFRDDEPLSVPSTTLNTGHEKVAVKTFTEYPAIAASDTISDFSVLLDVRGPPLSIGDGQSRVPVDLVFVLDVSGSMFGRKLSLLKSAARFVIDRMLPCDRLSIVTFSTNASRILPLHRMTEEGRLAARLAVDQLRADDSTNIVAGLNMGAKILEERRERNPVSSIIFVSDGEDTDNGGEGITIPGSDPPAYLKLLSSSIFCGNRDTSRKTEHSQWQRFPVHAFGVGGDHDPIAMNAISDASGGTFSFLQTAEVIPASFARCIGGLFSVVAQDVRLTVWSASPGVEIKAIPSGRHECEINSEKKQAVIHIGDLYAEEKKDFLVQVSVPVCSETKMEEDGIVGKTPLVDIVCYYRNPLSKEAEQIEVESVEILRPTAPFSADATENLEVDRQKNRVRVTESLEKAKEMADKGNLKEAQEMLTNIRATLLASASAKSGDVVVDKLEAELREITARMENMGLYERSGRPLLLAGLSAHNWQRATTLSHTIMQQNTRQQKHMHNRQRATTLNYTVMQQNTRPRKGTLSTTLWNIDDMGRYLMDGEMVNLNFCASVAEAEADCGSESDDDMGYGYLMDGDDCEEGSTLQYAETLQCAAAPSIYDTPLMEKLVSETAQENGTRDSSAVKNQD